MPPRMFMCLKHWRMIPKPMQAQLWELYVPGQEIRKDPTREYIEVAGALVRYVARKENVGCEDCANLNGCCMEHRIHVDPPKPHTRCILR